MGRILWCRCERPLDHGSDLVILDRTGSPRAGFVIKTINSIFQKPPPPFANSVLVNTQLCSNGFAGQPVSTTQDHSATIRE